MLILIFSSTSYVVERDSDKTPYAVRRCALWLANVWVPFLNTQCIIKHLPVFSFCKFKTCISLQRNLDFLCIALLKRFSGRFAHRFYSRNDWWAPTTLGKHIPRVEYIRKRLCIDYPMIGGIYETYGSSWSF